MKTTKIISLIATLTQSMNGAWTGHPFRPALRNKPCQLYCSDQLPQKNTPASRKFWWHFAFPTVGLATNPGQACCSYLPHQFSLRQLAPRRGSGVRLALIDTGLAAYTTKDNKHRAHPDLKCRYKHAWSNLDITSNALLPLAAPITMLSQQEYNPTQAHGTHTYGILAAQKNPHAQGTESSLCPKAEIIMIKAFDDSGTSDKETLIAAIKKTIELRADILLLSLKIDDAIIPDSPASAYINDLLHKVPYTIAAAGNGGNTAQLAYPARFDAITLSVGAFGINEQDNTCFLPTFSQYEPAKGPTFLAPGVDILSTAVPVPGSATPYLFLSGTSAAAAIVAGALALALAEFRLAFSKQQLMAIFKAAAVQIPHIPPQASLHGVLDIRTALFMLHAMNATKKRIKSRRLEGSFEEILKNLKDYLLKQPAPHQLDPHLAQVTGRTKKSKQHSLQAALRACLQHLLKKRTLKSPKQRKTSTHNVHRDKKREPGQRERRRAHPNKSE